MAIALGATGCNGGAAAKGASQPHSAQARLLEEENYRLGEQIKGLEKQIETLKADAAAALKDRTSQDEATATSMKFLMDQVVEKNAENEKLQNKVAELEKELAGLKGK